MTDSDHKAHALETAVESQPLLSTTTAVECLPTSHQNAFRSRFFGLFALCLPLVVAAFFAVLEHSQPLGDSFKRETVQHAIVFILLPLIAVVQVLITSSRNRLPLALKWLLVLAMLLSDCMLPAASDATENATSGLLAAAFVLCTIASLIITDGMTPEQLLDWRTTARVAATVTTVAMFSLYAWGQLRNLTFLGLLVLLLVELLLAGWFAFHATKIYATMEPSQLVEAGQALRDAERIRMGRKRKRDSDNNQ